RYARRSNKIMKRIIGYSITILILFVIRLLLHEIGHIITALIFGARITNIIIVPGIQLYPRIGFQLWNGFGGAIDYRLENGTPFKSGLITLMGSGFSAI